MKRWAAVAWGAISNTAEWAIANKPYIVAVIAGATAAYQALGEPVPTWLYVTYAALGGAALHSSTKANTVMLSSDPNIPGVNKP